MVALTSAVFALSGAAALVFETLWFHQAGLALGNSVMASSLVLAAFMTGLALGNGIAIRRGDRFRNPLHAFAALEVLIGIGGVALVFGLPASGPALAAALAPLFETNVALGAARFVAAFAMLAIPSTAMGLTLPLLTRALASGTTRYGPVLGRLYGWNTLGAVAGVAAAEALLIGALGLRGSALVAAVGNLVAAGGALWIARRLRRLAPDPSGPAADSASPRLGAAGLHFRLAAFGTGFALLALEVVVFRFLALFVVTRTESFAWMLCVALAGIGVGGLFGAWTLRRLAEAARLAGSGAFVAGAVLIASYAAFPALTTSLAGAKVSGASEVLQLCVPLLGPTAFLSGLIFTWLGAGLREALPSAAQTTGALTVANTLGAAAGSLAAAFVLLPGLGMEASLFALAVLYAAIGALLTFGGANRHSAATPAPRLAGAGAVLWLAAALLFPFGAMRSTHIERALEAYDVPEDARLHVREGVNETILWIETPFLGAPYTQRLVTNSFSMSATDVQARRYMKLYVYWPAAVHPALRSALLVSYGVGSTARALADTPGIERIDVVEISRDILEMSDLAFPDATRNPLRDPRVTVHVEDGRYFLATTQHRYDLITGEPPPPVVAGVVNLYTREYFERVRARLNEGGIFTTWLPLRQLSDTSSLSILRAFCDAFPDCSLWRGMSFELMLVGTRNAKGPVDAAHFGAQWRDPIVGPELRALGFERPEQLGALFIADADDLSRFAGNVPPLVDDRPKRISAEASSPDAQHRLYVEWLDPHAGQARFARSTLLDRLWPASERTASLPFFELQHLLDSFGQDIRSDRWSERFTDLRAVLGRSAARTPVLWLLGSDADAQRIIDAAEPEAREAPEVQLHLAARALADRDYARALDALERAEASPRTFERAAALRLFTLCSIGEAGEAQALALHQSERFGNGARQDDLFAWLGSECGVSRR